ncbi:MAG TPA: hypothetical protein VFG83_05745, partial [Kofleriaceae bacterium]|nr:hypothetical protein [Kofleriaceae bacterium]
MSRFAASKIAFKALKTLKLKSKCFVARGVLPICGMASLIGVGAVFTGALGGCVIPPDLDIA